MIEARRTLLIQLLVVENKKGGHLKPAGGGGLR